MAKKAVSYLPLIMMFERECFCSGDQGYSVEHHTCYIDNSYSTMHSYYYYAESGHTRVRKTFYETKIFLTNQENIPVMSNLRGTWLVIVGARIIIL